MKTPFWWLYKQPVQLSFWSSRETISYAASSMTTLGPIKRLPLYFPDLVPWRKKQQRPWEGSGNRDSEVGWATEQPHKLCKGQSSVLRSQLQKSWLGWWVALQKGTAAAAAIATAREEDERQSYSSKNKGAYRSIDVSRETGTQEGQKAASRQKEKNCKLSLLEDFQRSAKPVWSGATTLAADKCWGILMLRATRKTVW